MAKYFIYCYFLLVCLVPHLLWSQGTYYNSVDTGSSSFVADLHNLIYPHTKISYDQFDETNIANFASRDTTGGQKVVTCVYSGENFVYTEPFSWGTFSREHTFCHSWMPTNPSESRPEYSDQHHLFPTNQNNANGRRSNHPLGEVTTISYQYLEGMLGTNSAGETVYEPRESHKGDAARALLYMSLCYNGEGGYDWTFSYLNTVTLPAASEAPQDVDLLIQWHNQDPPDAWEIARNEYVYSIQGNRNPFVDHPEYVNVIDFNTLTKKTITPLAAEVTNYPDGFDTPVITSSSITVTWTDPSGAVLPTGYLLVANTTTTFTDPEDGTVYSDDTSLADGSARVNVPYGIEQYTFTGLNSSTQYSFRLYPYNGSGGACNYKTASFPGDLTILYTTIAGDSTAAPSVVVNEYFNGGTGVSEWVELLVLQNNLDMRGMKIRDYSSGGSQQNVANPLTFASVAAWQSVPYGTLIVIFKSGTGAPAEETDFLDKNVVLSASNSAYFTSPATPFDIAGSADAVEIFTAGNAHIHSLSHGSYPGLIASILQPRANATGASTSGNVVRFTGTSSVSHFSDTTKTGHSSSATMGAANDAVQQNFIETILPVELSSFTASAKENAVQLAWTTETETNNYGFEIQRSEVKGQKSETPTQPSPYDGDGKGGGWQRVGFVEGSGSSSTPKAYLFVDRNLHAGKYLYRLKLVDRDGTFSYTQEIEAVIAAPKVFALEQNYPNPFNPSTEIRYQMSEVSHVSLKVYDMLGRETATLVNEVKEAGEYSAKFDATQYPSGIYFYTLRAGNFVETKKMLLIK